MIKPYINKLKQYIDQYLELWDFFGVIQVIQRGEVVFERSSGYACLEFGIKNTVDSRFTLASVTKQFTAFAVMLLHDKGHLDLDRPANDYLPARLQIPENITVHHLLSHTSGLYNFYQFADDFFDRDNRGYYSRDEYFADYIMKQPVQEPGKRYDYNNSNYNLLAWIIEHVSGLAFDEFMAQHIYEPLQMKGSTIDDSDKIIAGKSFNYTKNYDSYVRCPYYNEKFSIGAGAMVSNCADLFKWHECLRDRKLLSAEAYERFFTANMNGYCYGLEHSRVYGTDRYAHGGDHLGVATYIQSFFAEDLCILILSNNEAVNQYKLGHAIADIVHGAEVQAPSKHAEMPAGQETLALYCGTYLPGKIQLEYTGGKLYFVRFKGSLYIELYTVAEGKFVQRYYDQTEPYSLPVNEEGRPQFFGFIKQETQ
ncbi:serine hydrolase domain-containing protein [Paenibacillus tepidiphilus]|uniref:serine hydrolase domain-containing protein n=1 Tax=Paenibacillus tepidiphilus TaxID=2608683 RepID=UPI001EF078AC|nr:serine hydrolase domain-containing protein [Paenibacillus tepidiphilus]